MSPIEFLAVLLRLALLAICFGPPVAMVIWILDHLAKRRHLLWLSIVGLAVWASMMALLAFAVLVGLGGHSPSGFGAIDALLLALLAASWGIVWYLYRKPDIGSPLPLRKGGEPV